MYSFRLFIKYLKYCIFKRPFIVTTHSEYRLEKLKTYLQYKDKYYKLTFPNEKIGIAHFKSWKELTYSRTYNKISYREIYKWQFLSYQNQLPIHQCNWKEFKSIYGTLFFPHLASEDEVTAGVVMDFLAPNNDIPDSFIVCKIER